ncbi:unnamed protein product [Bursaphelenchus xylophilus]|nr:unnamed protein product [Bursaphelenchus xylophilus]CAG9129153.1 unnamed protein product [Bursaphelenchus xylophilus]
MMNKMFRRSGRNPKHLTNQKPLPGIRMSLRLRDRNQSNMDNNNNNARVKKRSADAMQETFKPHEDEPIAKRPTKHNQSSGSIPCSNPSQSSKADSQDVISRYEVPRLFWEEDPAPDVDVDSASKGDPFAYSEYVSDVMIYLKSRELRYQPEDYIKTRWAQKNRAIAVDWLVEIQEMFKFNHETLYLGVNVMDRYYSKTPFHDNNKVQLVAICSIFVASKYEERAPPFLEDLCYLCRDIFTITQIREMEIEILQTIGFDLSAPLSYSFLRRYSRAIKGDMQLLTTARYALEESLHFVQFCRVSPSRIAVASLLWALRVTKKGDWSNVLEKYSGYRLNEVEPLVVALNHMVIKFPEVYRELIAVKMKYKNEVFMKVADQQPLPDLLPASSPVQPPEGFTRPESFPGYRE